MQCISKHQVLVKPLQGSRGCKGLGTSDPDPCPSRTPRENLGVCLTPANVYWQDSDSDSNKDEDDIPAPFTFTDHDAATSDGDDTGLDTDGPVALDTVDVDVNFESQFLLQLLTEGAPPMKTGQCSQMMPATFASNKDEALNWDSS